MKRFMTLIVGSIVLAAPLLFAHELRAAGHSGSGGSGSGGASHARTSGHPASRQRRTAGPATARRTKSPSAVTSRSMNAHKAGRSQLKSPRSPASSRTTMGRTPGTARAAPKSKARSGNPTGRVGVQLTGKGRQPLNSYRAGVPSGATAGGPLHSLPAAGTRPAGSGIPVTAQAAGSRTRTGPTTGMSSRHFETGMTASAAPSASPSPSPSPKPTPSAGSIPGVELCHDYLLQRAGLTALAQQLFGKSQGFSASEVTQTLNQAGWTPGDESSFRPGSAVQLGDAHCGYAEGDGTVSHYTKPAPTLGIDGGTHNQTLQQIKDTEHNLTNGTQEIINTPYKGLPVKVWNPPATPSPAAGPTAPTTPTTRTP
jgi:hypothetical protein